jgi:hypothetical protein
VPNFSDTCIPAKSRDLLEIAGIKKSIYTYLYV